MSDKLFRGITIALTALTVILLLRAGREIFEDNSSYTFDESSLVYAIKDGRYTDLIRYCDKNRTESVKVTEEIAECYAVADYYQATLLYYTYLERGEVQRQSEAQEVRKDAASRMGALSDYAGEIDTLFENYMAEH